MARSLSPALEKILREAEHLAADGNPQDALALLNEARRKEAAPGIFAAMAELFSTLGIDAGVEQVLQEGNKLFPAHPSLALQLANHYYRTDQGRKGLSLLKPYAEKADAGTDVLLTYAALCRSMGENETARALSEKILAREPQNAAALSNLAAMHLDARDYAKAIALFERARAGDPLNSHVTSQLAQAYFRNGNLEQGWEAYDARFGSGPGDPHATAQRRPYTQPLWQGVTLKAGQALLLWGEQGIGEEIMHASMLEETLAHAPLIIVECAPRLMPLFARSFPAIRFIARGETPVSDPSLAFQAPLGHLGFLFRKKFTDFPRRSAYLRADARKTADLRENYRALAPGKKIVGISWKSRKLRQGDPKSTDLKDWQPLFKNQDCFFIDLQYGADEKHPAIYSDPAVDQSVSLDDFAAQVAAMDAVVSVSNTTAHMAGALGIQSAVLLPAARGLMQHWFDNRGDSPWYPSLALLRQSKDGIWNDVIRRAAEFIKAL